MHDIFSKLSGDEILGFCGILVGVVAVLGCIGLAVTKVVATHFRRTQLDEMEATLKLEMIQRGMSAADIKQVLEARLGPARGTSRSDLLGNLPPLRMPGGGFAKEANHGV